MLDCIVDIHRPNKGGHSQAAINIGGRRYWVYCHVIAWESEYGPVPAGMRVTHTCGNLRCVNPDHLSLRTPSALAANNGRRGAVTRQYRTACRNGHERTPENSGYRASGYHYCIECLEQRQQRRLKKGEPHA